MKTIHSLLIFTLYIAGFMALTSCTAPPPGGTSPGTSVLSVNTIPVIKVHVISGPKLKVKYGGNCPATSNSKGCIDVAKGDTAEVTFLLRSAPSWYFTEFRICKGTDPDDLVCDLDLPQRADFKFTDGSGTFKYPDEDGIVKLDDFSLTLTNFDLEDANVIKQDYQYRIKACKTENRVVVCADSDPPIRNRGR